MQKEEYFESDIVTDSEDFITNGGIYDCSDDYQSDDDDDDYDCECECEDDDDCECEREYSRSSYRSSGRSSIFGSGKKTGKRSAFGSSGSRSRDYDYDCDCDCDDDDHDCD